MNHVIRPIVAGMMLVAALPEGLAQANYPTRPIRVIVPTAPGGPPDVVARLIAQDLVTRLGQPVVVENKAGAGTIIGSEFVARAPADGYTLLLTNFGWAVTPSLHEKLSYDVVRDFSPVGRIAKGSLVLLVNTSSMVKSVKELIAAARAKPGGFNYGSSGGGSSSNLGALLFQSMTGVRMTAITYRGGGPMLIALLGKELDLIFVSISAGMPLIRDGRLRALGVSSDTRSEALPDVPTIAEAGVPGYELDSWYGVAVPKGTPQSIIAKINRQIVRAIESAPVRKNLIAQGLEPASSSPEEFSSYVSREVARWDKLIRENKIRH